MNEDRTIFDTLADQYDKAWQSGDTPDLESYLSRVSDADRMPLAQMLLPIDIEYRRNRGNPVSANDYKTLGDSVHSVASEILAMNDSAFMETNIATPSSGANLNATASITSSTSQKSQVVGPYKLLQVLGEGGMGTVWMAEQTEPVRRRVALKLIKAGADSREIIARFEAERQALAMMDHPNIAKVLDAGTADDGTPYFVMELVQGIAINEYCDRNRLSPNERLSVLIPVCRAVQHAHQKGIIHRDLKPSNVLVAMHDGQPVAKVIDFGLAKAMQHQTWLTDKTMFTQFGQVVGTPQYMSPEQATLDEVNVDTRSDVYSLGVILYELLAGSTPIETDTMREHALLKVLELIREQEPPRPSDRVSTSGEQIQTISEHRKIPPIKLRQVLSGDLDWIVMKALDKDRSRRYESASNFADDIQRYLDGDAILARPPSQLYKFRKFVAKRKGLVAAVATILFLLVTGIAGTTIGMFRSIAAREDARASARIAEQQSQQASEARERAETARQKAEFAAKKAQTAEALALAARENAEDSLARSNFFLANARWDQDRVTEATQLLYSVPPKFRNVEWHLSRAEFLGSDQTGFGHSNNVTGVAFSPDGKWIASSSFDSSINLWEADTARLVRTLQLPPNTFQYCVAFSADSNRIASGGIDHKIRIWDVQSGEELQALSGHTDYVSAVLFSESGDQLISGGWDHKVKIWDLQKGKEKKSIDAHEESIKSISLAPDGKRLASCCNEFLKVWDLETGKELHQWKMMVSGTTFSRDGKTLHASDGDTLYVLDAKTGEQQTKVEVGVGNSRCIAISSDTKLIASSVFRTNAIRVSRADTGELVRVLHGHMDEIKSIAFSPDNRQLVSGGEDNLVKVWRVKDGLNSDKLFGNRIEKAAVISRDGTKVATRGWSKSTAHLWDAKSGAKLLSLGGPKLSIDCNVAFSNDGSKVATASGQNTIERWDAKTGELLQSLSGHEGGTLCVAFSNDDKYLVSGGKDNVARIWDAQTGNELHKLTGHKNRVVSLALSPDGSTLVTGGWGNQIKFWNLQNGKEIQTLTGTTGAGVSTAFTPDGKLLATGNWENAIVVWDVATGETVTNLRGHAAQVRGLVYSPDGTRLISGDRDGVIKIWDAATGSELKSTKDHAGSIDSISISKRGTRMVCSALSVTVDELQTKNRILQGHHNDVTAMTFSPDDRMIASLDGQVIHLWNSDDSAAPHVLTGNGPTLMNAAFSTDGKQLSGTDLSGARLVWDTATGERISNPVWAAPAPNRHLSTDKKWHLMSLGKDVLVTATNHVNDE